VIRDELKASIVAAVEKARAAGDLPALPPPVVELEHPAKAEQGDFATNVAMRLQKAAGKPPRAVAGAIVHHLELPAAVSTVQVAGPGFINFFLADEWVQDQVDAILAAGPRFGHLDVGAGQRVQVEFVSANPTGPLHVGAARNAALGDSLCRVLAATGHAVEREYYVNDAGSQIAALGASVLARYKQRLGVPAEMPENGYAGEYVGELAQEVEAEHGRALLELSEEAAIERVGPLVERRVLAWIEQDLADLGVRFDRWFSERSLYRDGQYETVMRLLREGGHVVERDGAVWFAASDGDEDRENVLVRSNGQPTYFASDVAYHYDKLVLRGFDRAINVWAADHHGHVPRMKAVARALGIDPDRLVVLLYQLVKLYEHGAEKKMSKRAGTYVTVRELLDEVGADAARFFLISRSSDVTINFDLHLAKQTSDENPVYYVQYAHARTASILREAVERLGGADHADGDVRLLAHPSEMALIRKLLLFPEVVESAAATLAPHQLTFYVQDLAGTFSAFYRDCPVLPPRNPDAALANARLKLVAATKAVLAGGLDLIGVTAPERMAERATEG
jgi:arginyl-tRNA synthetase